MQQHENFNMLEKTLQSFVKSSSDGRTAFSNLLAHQAAETRAFVYAESCHTRQQLQSWRHEEGDQASYDRLLQSLGFESMNLRQNEIEERHDKTFEWIYSGDPEHFGYSLRQWLKTGEGVYWISGKAGSGKSTFIKFLCQDIRTQEALQDWREETVILSFFFLRSGSALQRSFKGLLTALLYQLLQKDAHISRQLLYDRPTLKLKSTNADWSIKEITEILLLTLTLTKDPLCVFLDGLDEFDSEEGYDKVLKTIDRLTSSEDGPPLKICVSSRPEPELKQKFNHCPNLKLQDLTREDMIIYASDLLQEAPAEMRTSLVDTVLYKADGVFLWVHYVLRSLTRGLSKHDDWEELGKRIEALPSRMEELYHDMWQRLNEDRAIYREEAARFFHISLELETPSIFQFMIASEPLLQESFLERHIPVSANDLIKRCERTEQRILTRCAGLLEINGGSWSHYGDEEASSDEEISQSKNDGVYIGVKTVLSQSHIILLRKFADSKIYFLHRTARDFLIDTEPGQGVLSFYSPPAVAPRTLWLRVQLIDMLAGLQIFDWEVAEVQMRTLVGSRPDLLTQDGTGTLELMHQVYDRLTSRNLPRLVSGYSNYFFANPRGCPSRPTCYRDFIGFAASYCCTTYLHNFLSKVRKGFKPRTEFIDYLLLCASMSVTSTAEHIRFLLDQGANPNARGSYRVNDEDFYSAFSPLPALLIGCLQTHFFRPWQYTLTSLLDEVVGDVVDVIKAFVDYHIDVSEKILISSDIGGLTLLPRQVSSEDPYLVYETTVGEVISYTLAYLGATIDRNLEYSEDHAKARRILFVSDGGPFIKARKVSSEEDAALLSKLLDAYLSILNLDTVCAIKNPGMDYADIPEYVELSESITEVDARSEPVDVYETMIELGYMRPWNYDFSPIEPFERIGAEAVSDDEKQKKDQNKE